MTHQQKIAFIREACIKANPEIMSLGFGCEGRPIRLADVLLAIGRREDRIHLSCDGWFCLLDAYTSNFMRRFNWYLHKDSLEDQSEETIDFIYSLLE